MGGNLLAQHPASPEEFMRHYMKVFNNQNAAEVQQCYHFPYAVIENGQLAYHDKENVPVVDYETLKKSGWAQSSINDIQVLLESATTAVVRMDFSRLDKQDKEYFRTTMIYTLTKEKGYWQIINRTSR